MEALEIASAQAAFQARTPSTWRGSVQSCKTLYEALTQVGLPHLPRGLRS